MITTAIWLAFLAQWGFAIGTGKDPRGWTAEENTWVSIACVASIAAAILATIAVNP